MDPVANFAKVLVQANAIKPAVGGFATLLGLAALTMADLASSPLVYWIAAVSGGRRRPNRRLVPNNWRTRITQKLRQALRQRLWRYAQINARANAGRQSYGSCAAIERPEMPKNRVLPASAMEDLARDDFLAAIETQCGIFQVPPLQLATTEKYAPAPQPAPTPAPPRVPDRMAIANAMITEFRGDSRNEFMPIVEPAMLNLLQTGQATSLYQAYSDACLTSPHFQEILMARKEINVFTPRSSLRVPNRLS